MRTARGDGELAVETVPEHAGALGLVYRSSITASARMWVWANREGLPLSVREARTEAEAGVQHAALVARVDAALMRGLAA
jgi:hypothetical protein